MLKHRGQDAGPDVVARAARRDYVSLVARTLLFVDDDLRFLDDVQAILDADTHVLTASSVAGALAIEERPDVAFIDLHLPDGDGVGVVRELAARWPDTPLVMLTVSREDGNVLDAFRAGARGYLFKEDLGERLPVAIREALEGGAPMSADVAKKILGMVAGLPRVTTTTEEKLTDQELRIVKKLAEGCSYVQAGSELRISVNTVRAHIRNVYRKLSVGTKTEAVMAALQLGLLDH